MSAYGRYVIVAIRTDHSFVGALTQSVVVWEDVFDYNVQFVISAVRGRL